MDPFLYLIDLDAGTVITTDDNSGPGDTATLLIFPQAGRRYGIGASSSTQATTGSYVLKAVTF